MPVAERFKRGINAIKACFGDRSENLREPQIGPPLDTSILVELPASKCCKSASNDGKESTPKPTNEDLTSLRTDSLMSVSEDVHLLIGGDFWSQAAKNLESQDSELVYFQAHEFPSEPNL